MSAMKALHYMEHLRGLVYTMEAGVAVYLSVECLQQLLLQVYSREVD